MPPSSHISAGFRIFKHSHASSRLITSSHFSVATRGCGAGPLIRTMLSSPLRMGEGRDYNKWTKESLIKHIKRLENEIRIRDWEQAKPTPAPGASEPTTTTSAPSQVDETETPPAKKQKKNFDASKYSSRFIALKFAYLGKKYSGLEYTSTGTMPSIEEELWKALVKARLIFPERPEEVNFNCCEYSKCGRTDRGVSAFGQVVGIRVRSNKPRVVQAPQELAETREGEAGASGEEPVVEILPDDGTPWPVKDEIEYCRVLNRLLPPDIRLYAWCPVPPPGFSARFSCRERQYRYFFTQPAFAPIPSSLEQDTKNQVKPGWLDIEAMRKAAKMFEGLHDFRNFCKVDASKQITNFERRIFEADIVEADDFHSSLPFLSNTEYRPASMGEGSYPKVYYFHVRGSAFLWHQIRHMVSILFLVGQGLESPSIVTKLLDVEKHPQKPNYVLAEDTPLVLWDCLFGGDGEKGAKDTLEWVYVGKENGFNLHGTNGLVNSMWETWREAKMDEILANRLLDWMVFQTDAHRGPATPVGKQTSSIKIFEGGNTAKPAGKWTPVLEKQMNPSPEEINDRWAQKKGYANAAEMQARGNWRSEIRAAKLGAAVDDGGVE